MITSSTLWPWVTVKWLYNCTCAACNLLANISKPASTATLNVVRAEVQQQGYRTYCDLTKLLPKSPHGKGRVTDVQLYMRLGRQKRYLTMLL